MLADSWRALSARGAIQPGGTRGAGASSPYFSFGSDVVTRGRAATFREKGSFARQLWTVTVSRSVYRDRECVSDCSALTNGCSDLDCSVIGFCIFPTIKLGMHKMELGDSVYAAERIMKKRIRKVSFISLQNIAVTDSNLAKLACEITYQWRVWLVRFICKLLVSQHANAWLFMLAPNIKTCFYNALYKMLRMNVVYILWINPSIVRWRQLFRNYRKGFVFLFMRVFRSLLLLRVPLHKSCVKTGGHSEKLNKFLYNRCPSLDKFLTVNKFGRTVWGVTLPYCNVHFFTIFFESCPVTNLIPTLITINFAFGFSFLFALS